MNILKEIFETPMLKYLRLKKAFLKEFLDPAAWGEQASEKRIVAISKFLEYLEETKELAAIHPAILEGQVILDNKNLVLERILPLPPKLYEEILWNIVKDDECGQGFQLSNEEALEKIESFLFKKHRCSVMIFEAKIWGEVHDYESYREPTKELNNNIDEKVQDVLIKPKKIKSLISKINRLRSKIYAKAKTGSNVTKEINKYETEVYNFIERFREDLHFEVISSWMNKIETTKEDVKNIRMKNKTPLTEVNSAESKVNSFESVEAEENLLNKLPNVPSEVDADIEERLLRLKFFRQVWESKKEDESISNSCFAKDYKTLDNNEKISFKAESDESKAVNKNNASEYIVTSSPKLITAETKVLEDTTEQDRLEFNSWYYKRIDDLKNSKENLVHPEIKTNAINNIIGEEKTVKSFQVFHPSQLHVDSGPIPGVHGQAGGTVSDMLSPSVGFSNAVILQSVLILTIAMLNLLKMDTLHFPNMYPVYISSQAAPCSSSNIPMCKLKPNSKDSIWTIVRNLYSSWRCQLWNSFEGLCNVKVSEIQPVKNVDWDWVDRNLLRDSSWY